MKIHVLNDQTISIELPMKNDGKFRWKNRANATEYGTGFSTKAEPYQETSYVEWQIGYDFPKNKEDDYSTILYKKTFVGANKKVKLPFELSEIFYKMIEVGLITDKEFKELIDAIDKSDQFLDEAYQIQMKKRGRLTFCGIEFMEQEISLPTFSYQLKDDDPVIEVSIQKQQYATGVQPMVYLSIPISQFMNGKDYIGKTYDDLSSNARVGLVNINASNKIYFLNLFRIFSICSRKHKHDVNEIFKLIEEYVNELNSAS